jgi:hypothetical protein
MQPEALGLLWDARRSGGLIVQFVTGRAEFVALVGLTSR